MERLKHLIVRTPLETPLWWLRLASQLPWRLRYPELGELYLEPVRFEKVLAKILTPTSNFVDVGAHLGSVLSSVLKFAPKGQHYAFEPTPHKAKWLREKFPEVIVSEVAVSDFRGPATFFEVPSESALSGLRSEAEGEAETREFAVSCDLLDACLPPSYRPDVLKVDVIGAELQVLRGAEGVVQRARPIILFASGTEKLDVFGVTPADLFAWFAERDYDVFLLKDYLSGDDPVDRERFLTAHDYPYQAFNFVARPAAPASRQPLEE